MGQKQNRGRDSTTTVGGRKTQARTVRWDQSLTLGSVTTPCAIGVAVRAARCRLSPMGQDAAAAARSADIRCTSITTGAAELTVCGKPAFRDTISTGDLRRPYVPFVRQ